MRSSRVYYPCIPGVEMLEIRISLTSPLLVLRGGWEAGIMNKHTPIMDTLPTNVVSSRKRVRSNDSSDDDHSDSDVEDEHIADWFTWPRFIVLKPVEETQPLTKLSPFAVEKYIFGMYGTVKKVSKMKCGSLLIEASRITQAKKLMETEVFMDIDVRASPHRSLNTSKGVVRDHGRDLFDMSEADIVMELKDQGVREVSRFYLKKDGKEIKTNTLFITFGTPTPPAKLKIGYCSVTVNLYILNPLRCFDCQEFGHSRKFCKKKVKCWKCGEEGHDGSDCSAKTPCCVNCKGEHFSSSKSCPVWILEKEIQRVKAEKSLPYGEARRLVTASSPSKAPSSYATAVKSSVSKPIPKRSVECQTPDFWLPDTPSLLELSKKPPILTQSTASGTNEQVSPMNKTYHKEQINKTITQKVTKKAPTVQNKQTTLVTGNKFQHLPSDVDEDMDDSRPPSRPPRSRSRSRRRSGKISPVKYK